MTTPTAEHLRAEAARIGCQLRDVAGYGPDTRAQLTARMHALRAAAAAVEARRYALTLSTLEVDILECVAEGVTDPDDLADACDRHRNECTRVVQHLRRRGMVRDGEITQDGRDALAYSLQAMDNDQ